MLFEALKLLIGNKTQLIEAYTNKTLTCGELEYRGGDFKVLGQTVREIVEIRFRAAEMPAVYVETKASKRFIDHGREEAC